MKEMYPDNIVFSSVNLGICYQFSNLIISEVMCQNI